MAHIQTVCRLLIVSVAIAIGIEAACLSEDDCLKIGAFNCQTFGVAKMSDPNRANIIAEIISRYDVMLLQEIRDSKGSSITDLMNLLQGFSTGPYEIELSERLGRSSTYKEQYAYIYRTNRVKWLASYQYDDGPDDYSDKFEREPFCVHMETKYGASPFEFTLVGLHSKPTDAVSEIKELYNVTLAAKSHLPTQNLILLGDLNADCTYFKPSDIQHDPIGSSPFEWLIDETADTTVTSTDCAYDRIIVNGNEVENAVKPNSAAVYLFDADKGLSNEEALDVSDHYPVEVEFLIPSGTG